MSNTHLKVALLGLGTMGTGMAQSLLRAGIPLTVYNRTEARADALVTQGAQKATSPAQAAESADVIIVMVSDDPASRALWLGNDGLLAHAKHDAILIEMSTLSLDWVRELADHAKVRSLAFLDVPVSGSRDAAAGGKLRLYVGGDAAILEQVRPILDALSSVIFHVGDVGAGTATKLVVNTLIAAQMASLAEALRLGEHLDIDRSQLAEIIDGASFASALMRSKLEGMVKDSYGDAAFKLALILKDVTYAQKAGSSIDLPVLHAIQQAYQVAQAQGLGESDFSAVAAVK
jgi:3-hydroxyisobutyrate dehydrogenase